MQSVEWRVGLRSGKESTWCRSSNSSGGKGKFIENLMTGIQVSLVTRLVVSMASHGLYFFYWYVMAAMVVVASKLVEQNGVLTDEKKLQHIQNPVNVIE